MPSSSAVSQNDLHSTEAELGTALMAGGLVTAGNEVIKGHDASIPAVAIGAGAAFAGYKMMEDAADNQGPTPSHHRHKRTHRSSSVGSRSSSDREETRGSGAPHHHRRNLLEEAIGLYGLTKEVMGDKRHHILHVLEEIVGVIGATKELSSKDKGH